jgi:CHAD domain-containing protein
MARKRRASRAQKLLEHIDSLRDKLAEQTPMALQTFDAESVHAARVATRRLGAALDLLAPVLGKSDRKPLSKGLKRLRRRLGRLRDADVLLDRLAEISPEVRQATAVEWLRLRLEKSHRKLKEQNLKKTPPQRALRQLDDWGAVRTQIEEADEAIGSLLAESLHLQTEALVEQASQLEWTIHAVPEARQAPQHPHEVRIAAKNLRYTLEIAEVCRRPLPSSLMNTFKKMQDQLGAWHDWVVLAERTLEEVVQNGLAQDATSAQAALELARLCLRRSERELQAFARTWKRRGMALATKIRAAYPLTTVTPASPPAEGLFADAGSAAATESETDPGLPDSAKPESPAAVR